MYNKKSGEDWSKQIQTIGHGTPEEDVMSNSVEAQEDDNGGGGDAG